MLRTVAPQSDDSPADRINPLIVGESAHGGYNDPGKTGPERRHQGTGGGRT